MTEADLAQMAYINGLIGAFFFWLTLVSVVAIRALTGSSFALFAWVCAKVYLGTMFTIVDTVQEKWALTCLLVLSALPLHRLTGAQEV